MLYEIIKTLLLKLGDYSKYVVILFAIFLGISLYRNFSRIKGSNDQVEIVRERIEQLERENIRIKQELMEKESEEFIEKELRDKLNLAREGEIVVVLPDEEILKKLAPKAEVEEDVLPDPNWMKWLKLFL